MECNVFILLSSLNYYSLLLIKFELFCILVNRFICVFCFIVIENVIVSVFYFLLILIMYSIYITLKISL